MNNHDLGMLWAALVAFLFDVFLFLLHSGTDKVYSSSSFCHCNDQVDTSNFCHFDDQADMSAYICSCTSPLTNIDAAALGGGTRLNATP